MTTAAPLLLILILLCALVWIGFARIWTEHTTPQNAQLQAALGMGDPLTKRTHFKLFGLMISSTRYAWPVPSASGAPVGITRSLWIYTGKRAWGYGTVVDWAKLQNLELKIGIMAPIVSEQGSWFFQPPYRVDGDFEIAITNRNTCDAIGTLTFFEWVNTETSLGLIHTGEQGAIQFHFAVLKNARKLQTMHPERPRFLTRCVCQTEPASSSMRRARIYGRPEWLG